MKQKQKTDVAGVLGECVHVAGMTNFLRRAMQRPMWSVSLTGSCLRRAREIEASTIAPRTGCEADSRENHQGGKRLSKLIEFEVQKPCEGIS